MVQRSDRNCNVTSDLWPVMVHVNKGNTLLIPKLIAGYIIEKNVKYNDYKISYTQFTSW